MKKAFVLFLLLLIIQLKVDAQEKKIISKKFSPQEMRSDAEILKNILEANHPSLYWYTPKDSLDYFFTQTLISLNDSLTEINFKNKLSNWVTKIKCGHTTVRLSRKLNKELIKNKPPQFPLQLKVWNDSLVVISNAFINNSSLKRGVVVESINGFAAKKIIDSIFTTISTDGNSLNHKNQVASNSFPYWYNAVWGFDTTYNISYYDSLGLLQTAIIKNYVSVKTPNNKTLNIAVRANSSIIISKRQQLQLSRRSLVIDTLNGSAIMRLNTFSNGSLKLFFKRSFRDLRKLAITTLVLDCRNNGGGRVDNSIRLTQYLINKPFKIGDSVVAVSRKFNYARYINPSFIYWLSMNIAGTKLADGLIHYRRYEKHFFEPNKKNHFSGTVFLLQGGNTFSAATMFIAALKRQENITLVGEETGGGYYGNSAMHIPTITLPNSKLRIGLPMYRLVMDKSRPKGRGIMPDIFIPPSLSAIKEGVDLKMKNINELIHGNDHLLKKPYF